jgi:hypothetical protein
MWRQTNEQERDDGNLFKTLICDFSHYTLFQIKGKVISNDDDYGQIEKRDLYAKLMIVHAQSLL